MSDFLLIGDIHSQLEVTERALDYARSNNLRPVFLGDIFDSRCSTSDSPGVYASVRAAQRDLNAVVLRSNHQDKLERYYLRRQVRVMPELERTIQEFRQSSTSESELLNWLQSLPYGFCFRDSSGKEYRCAHAFFPSWLEFPRYEGDYEVRLASAKAKSLMMYGPSHNDGKGRVFWWQSPGERDWVRVAGHYHVIHQDEKSLILDGGVGGVKRSWFCNEPPVLCMYDTFLHQRIELPVQVRETVPQVR